jgi:hypothetical protein
MSGKFACWCGVLVFAVLILAPAAVQADPQADCPGSSYTPCHYNFPLLWKGCARLSSRWHATREAPPPFSTNYYEYRSHCPYAVPAVLLGFPSLVQRSRLPSGEQQ